MSSMAPEIDEGEGEGLDVLAVLAELQTRLTDVELARDMLRQRNQQLQMQLQPVHDARFASNQFKSSGAKTVISIASR